MNERFLTEDIFRTLRILSSDSDLSQRDISHRLDISLGKANYLMKVMAQKGFIKSKRLIRKDRKMKKIRYILTPEGFKEKARLTYHFLKKKEKEYLELKKEADENMLVDKYCINDCIDKG